MEELTAIAAPELPTEIAEYVDDTDPEVRGPWRIENSGSADWALSRLAECEAEADEIEAQFEATVRRARARCDEIKKKAQRGAEFFRFRLIEYVAQHRNAVLGGSKKKSRDFLHGRLGFRKRGGKLVVTNKEALVAWLSSQPVESGLFRMKLEPEMKALQSRFKSTGEVFPGCEYEPESDEPYAEAVSPAEAIEVSR